MNTIDIDSLNAQETIELIAELQQSIWARCPVLVALQVTDDGETYEALRCPVCHTLVNDAGELFAVDIDERHSPAEPDMDHQDLDIDGDQTTDYGDTLYFLHKSTEPPHLVVPPAHWSASWT